MKYAVDPSANPKTIVLAPGGCFNDDIVISGQVGTISDDRDAIALFDKFAREIKARFQKVRSYYVGPQAKAMLQNGARLTTGIRSPRAYDLTP